MLYAIGFIVIALLPEKATINVKELVDVQDCPSCCKESLSKVKLNVIESVENPRKLALSIEYCNECKKIWVDGQKLEIGDLYNYIENSLVSVYGDEAPLSKDEIFSSEDFDTLLADIEKAKIKTKKT